jgi:hypothetical protein
LIRERLRAAFAAWRAREVVSNRMLSTGVGLAAIGIPFSLWYVVIGPTAGDRLVALGFLVGTVVLATYSLWEAKNVDIRRPDPRERDP